MAALPFVFSECVSHGRAIVPGIRVPSYRTQIHKQRFCWARGAVGGWAASALNTKKGTVDTWPPSVRAYFEVASLLTGIKCTAIPDAINGAAMVLQALRLAGGIGIDLVAPLDLTAVGKLVKLPHPGPGPLSLCEEGLAVLVWASFGLVRALR